MFMFEDDELECRLIHDQVTDYLSKLQDCDDEETKRIASRAFGYLMKVSFDDLSDSLFDVKTGMVELHNNLTNNII